MKIKLFFLTVMCTQMLFSQDWKADFDQAKIDAKSSDKLIVLIFQGSDWCAPCIKLENDIWSSSQFIEYANSYLIMVKADFPRKKKNQLSDKQTTHNRSLAEQYNKNGYFPLVVVFNSNAEIIGTTGYDKNKSPVDYVNLIKSYHINDK